MEAKPVAPLVAPRGLAVEVESTVLQIGGSCRSRPKRCIAFLTSTRHHGSSRTIRSRICD